jgi:hypothetical protein
MGGWKKCCWLGLGLIAILMLTSCSESLVEAKRRDGGVERIRVDSDSLTDNYEDKLRFHNRSKKEQDDDLSIILKKESTF